MAVFSDGFESNDFSAWDGTSATGTNSTGVAYKYGGSYGARHLCAGSGEYAYCYESMTLGTTNYYRFYLYIQANAGSSWVRFGGLRRSTWAQVLQIGLNAGAWKIWYRAGGADQTDTSATSPNTGQWYCVELYQKVDASVGEVKVYIDGVELADLTNTGLDTSAETPDKIWNGIASDWDSTEIYTDDVVVDTSRIGCISGVSIPVMMHHYNHHIAKIIRG